MMRKPALWIILAILGLIGAVTAARLFPLAFPLLSVDIEMDREGALEEAGILADRFEWGPADFRQAASFYPLDPTFQTYLELEGGGLEELNRRVSEGAFSLYLWRVRHFSQGVVEEVELRFTPSGAPYGFSLLLSEDAPGTNLPLDQARELAVAAAVGDWGVDPRSIELLESSQEEQPGGRIDHTFVYRRSDLDLGEAELRLRLRVAGDRLAEVTRFAHVPEAFERNYQSTRDANDAIALAGTIVFVLLFLILGGVGGTIHLIRERWIEWKAPLIWGAIVAGLMALNAINALPLTWMVYDTAMAPAVFIGTNVAAAGLLFLVGTAFLAFVFMAGESLLRKGFPDQLQQWRIWSPGVANSRPALGLTAAPYFIVGIELAYVVVFYLVVTRLFGWWSPASSMVEPDILATHLPWLPAVGTSLFAAFWEESVFRAIPIGAAALLGRKYGRPWVWIWSVVVLQAVVFGASHANYPQDPSFARVVEIFPVYLAWGVICVYFGLVPSIIGHFLYDLALFSIPLFAAETPGIWASRIIVIAIGLLPLGVLMLARWRQGAVDHAPAWALNRAWTPSPSKEASEADPLQRGRPEGGALEGVPPSSVAAELPEGPERPVFPLWGKVGVGVLGLAGLVFWGSTLEMDQAPRVEMARNEAESAARRALEAEGAVLDEEWTPLFSMVPGQDLSHEFAWRQGTADDYREMVGSFLDPPHWELRFVRFEVAPEERAEEYTVRLTPSGDLLEVRHELPEARPGAALEEAAARDLALRALDSRLGVAPGGVREISAEETVRPNRTDWTFTFSATEGYPLEEGEGRLTVLITGEEIAAGGTFVHVPEEWEREWRGDQSRRMLAVLPLGAVLFLLLGAVGVLGVVRGARGTLEMAPLRILGGTLLLSGLITALNEWPRTLGGFGPEEAFMNQAGVAVFGLVMGIGLVAGCVALFGALAHSWLKERGPSVPGALWWGLGLGVAVTGLVGLASSLTSSGPPAWPSYSNVVSYLPWLSVGAGFLTDFLGGTAVALILLASLPLLRDKGKGWLAVPLLLVLGLTIAPNPPGSSWAVWGVVGVAAAVGIGLVGFLCGRLGWAVLPGFIAASTILEQVEVILIRPFPGSVPGALFGLALVVVAMTYWTRALQEPGSGPAANPAEISGAPIAE